MEWRVVMVLGKSGDGRAWHGMAMIQLGNAPKRVAFACLIRTPHQHLTKGDLSKKLPYGKPEQ
jgi:hypothetical protein